MNRVAQLSDAERNELFSLTAERRGIGQVAIIEKDFWVCWVLKQLFEHPTLSKQLIFKGGTSLSKVYGLIVRFSEDIDLVLDWRVVCETEDPMGERSRTKQRELNETLNEKACTYIAETMLPLLEEALGTLCKLEVIPNEKDQGHVVRVEYPKTMDPGGLLPYIQLETGPLASWLPHSEHTITPYAAEAFPDLFGDPLCMVRAIDAERTFWEKATILHHEAHRPEDSAVPARYSRHYYDLSLMAVDKPLKAATLDNLDLLQNVVLFKNKFYPRGWANYDTAKPVTLKLVPQNHVLSAMRADYAAMQDMIFGRRPSFDEMIASLTALENEINRL
jgi:hypothetical protein